MSLMGMFRRHQPADGAAPALEAFAIPINPDPADVSDPLGRAVAPKRRDREVDTGSDLVAEALGAKLLHGWLQNRHQTLVPLSLNLSILSPERQHALARVLASLVLAGRPPGDATEFAPAMRSWLGGLGADADVLESFDGAMAAPLPLNVLFETVQAHQLTVYAYVAATVASEPHHPVSTMLCDIIQVRFDLPTALVRSAIRRYRR